MGVSAQIKDGVNGILLAPGKGLAQEAEADVAFGRAVLKLLGDPQARARLGKAAACARRKRRSVRACTRRSGADPFASPRMVADRDEFRARGFVVLRAAFDPEPLAREIDRALAESRRGTFTAKVEGGVIQGAYVPMTCARTPESLKLLDRLEPIAAALIGAPVLPTRAKGILYAGASPWHRDATEDVGSVGFAVYLEPLRAETGALRVVPGSQKSDVDPRSFAADAGCAIDTDPGDVIAFDERLVHGSSGGRNRRQWRVDFVPDPVTKDAEERVRAWYARQHPPDWDGGYDVDLYPSYGPDWLRSGRRAVARLRDLGVYEAAAKEESFARERR
jgi:hypothetical protein